MSWEKVKLSEVCTFKTGKLNSNAAVEGGIYPFFTCSPQTLGINTFAFDTEAVLLAGNNASGVFPLKYYKGKFNAYQRTYVIRSSDHKRLTNRFLFYSLIPTLKYFQSVSIGAATQYLTKGILDNFELPIPSVKIQTRIASILSAYDDLIENNNRRITLLEESARQLYREWFVRLRFPGHENTKITDGVPEGWERAFVPEIIDINPKEKIEKGKDIRSIPMACLSTDSTVIDTNQVEIKPKASGAKFRNGDVILPRITPCLENGKTALVQFLFDNEVACGSTEYIILRGQKVSPEFTYCLARTYKFRENAIKSMVGSSGRQRVQVSCFQDFLIPLAPKILLDQFDSIAKPNFLMIQTLQIQNQKLKAARDLLLPKLMNGEIPI